MWPEVEKIKSSNRYELILSGKEISNRLKDTGLDLNIFALTSLNYLDIHGTILQEIPNDISKLEHLQTLVLHSNQLQEFNENINKLDKLKHLDVSRNQLKNLPETINNLSNIVTINLSYNILEQIPKLDKTTKLSVLNLSNNKLNTFPEIWQLTNLSELKLNENQIVIIPPEIKNNSMLKVLELSNNKIQTIPGELSECTKLKVLDLKSNPISDKRLQKLIDKCHIKQIIDYVKTHCHRTIIEKVPKENNTNKQSPPEDHNFKFIITVNYAKDNIKVIINESVKSVREFFIACLVNNLNFNEETFKKFIQIQNKLHDTVCCKRNSSTIATHDFNKLPSGDLHYTTLPPSDLKIHPLNRPSEMTGADLFSRLQTEANNLRKEKKRNTYSGIHKYLYLIEGQPKYPCLMNSEKTIISFPPITNSEVTKITPETKKMLIEVTSSISLHLCKVAMEALLKELVFLLEQDLDITQIKTTDPDGNLKVVYPSKTDLIFEGNSIKVVRS